MRKALRDHTDALCEALRLDLHKSASESYLTEIGIVLQEIARHLRRLKRWTAGETRAVAADDLAVRKPHRARAAGRGADRRAVELPGAVLLNPLVGALVGRQLRRAEVLAAGSAYRGAAETTDRRGFPPGYVSFLEEAEVVEEVLKQRFDSIFLRADRRSDRR